MNKLRNRILNASRRRRKLAKAEPAPKLWRTSEKAYRRYAPVFAPIFWVLGVFSTYFGGLLFTSPSALILTVGLDYFVIQSIYLTAFLAVTLLLGRICAWILMNLPLVRRNKQLLVLVVGGFFIGFLFLCFAFWGTATILIIATSAFAIAAAVGVLMELEGWISSADKTDDLIGFFTVDNPLTFSKWRVPIIAMTCLVIVFSIGAWRNYTEEVGVTARIHLDDGTIIEAEVFASSPSGIVAEYFPGEFLSSKRSFIFIPHSSVKIVEFPRIFGGGYLLDDFFDE